MSRLRWGVANLAQHYATEHFLVAGATGAGKSVLINMLMRSVLEKDEATKQIPPVRAMVYDPKQDVLPLLYGLIEDYERVKVLHPFDLRGKAWDLPADIDGPISARQFATILVPERESASGGSAESFFNDAVRDLLAGVLLVFINCVPKPGVWTFRDVILTLLYQPYLEAMLSFNKTRDNKPFPYAARLRQSYLLGDERTVSNIRATINSRLSIFEPVAAAWQVAQKAKQTFSLRQWLKEDCRDVLVLGNDEAGRAAIDAINQAIFKRATELLLARREVSVEDRAAGKDLTWFFLDEVRQVGRLDGLSALLTKGRSKGACVVLGFQDIDGMRHVYGNEVAHEICGQCNNVAVLKLSGASTAEWAVELFGKRLTEEETSSEQMDTQGRMTATDNIGKQERPYVFSAEFLYLPKTGEKNGLHGFFRGTYSQPEHGFLKSMPWYSPNPDKHPAIHDLRPSSHPGANAKFDGSYWNFWPRPVKQHYLEPWDQEDWTRLGMEGEVPTLLEEKEGSNSDSKEKVAGVEPPAGNRSSGEYTHEAAPEQLPPPPPAPAPTPATEKAAPPLPAEPPKKRTPRASRPQPHTIKPVSEPVSEEVGREAAGHERQALLSRLKKGKASH